MGPTGTASPTADVRGADLGQVVQFNEVRPPDILARQLAGEFDDEEDESEESSQGDQLDPSTPTNTPPPLDNGSDGDEFQGLPILDPLEQEVDFNNDFVEMGSVQLYQAIARLSLTQDHELLSTAI